MEPLVIINTSDETTLIKYKDINNDLPFPNSSKEQVNF